MTELPAPFNLSLDAFLKGPDNTDAEILVDKMYARPFRTILHEICEHTPEDYTPEALSSRTGSPSTCRPGYRYVSIPSGVALLDDRSQIVGAYAGSDLVLKPALKGFGLGRELVVERALRHPFMPPWREDEPAYTPAGLAAHKSAWQRAQDNPDFVLLRIHRID